jgi:lipopolysaccharide/colanic/teichoic acid biosynthesis glycosyltransferase
MLHALGLTNLSDADIERYYEVKLGIGTPNHVVKSKIKRGGLLKLKRLIDFTFALVSLILFVPTLAVLAIAIKLDSPGPVLSKRKRFGFGKSVFTLYRFRTTAIYKDTKNEVDNVGVLAENKYECAVEFLDNPTVTRIGKFLRRTSLDELPQLFNVLKGDMSLVGPRPLPINDYIELGKSWSDHRFSLKPGITCLWAIEKKGIVTFEKWMELDLHYIDNWSLMLDLKILYRTPLETLGVSSRTCLEWPKFWLKDFESPEKIKVDKVFIWR